MSINNIIKKKALPSFCTSNTDVLESIIFFCNLNKLPCLVECTSNQVNQNGGYTGKTPKKFYEELIKISKKKKFKRKNLYLGGDHLGPLPWKSLNSKIAIKNSIIMIKDYLKKNFCKIHIDTSIKCSNDKFINNEIIFDRSKIILSDKIIRKKINKLFLVIGTEVPLSGSNSSKKIVKTSYNQILGEIKKFKENLQLMKSKNKMFALVIEPGMKYLHTSIISPKFSNFKKRKKLSLTEKFVFEAHSTDYQSLNVLKLLVKNNFKFLKVGPELTYNFSRSLFFMQRIEEVFFKKNKSDLKKTILSSMLKNKKYWKDYYDQSNSKLLLNSKLDRMRYYLNTKKVKESIETIKKNINRLQKKELIKYLNTKDKKQYLIHSKKNLSNFDIINLIFISKSLFRYYQACGYKF